MCNFVNNYMDSLFHICELESEKDETGTRFSDLG